MSLPQNLGRLSAALTSDASLNIGVGVTPSGSFKLEVGTTSKFTGVATFGSTLSNGTYSYTLPGATGTLALVGGAGVGTVTSVAAITLGTSGTDLSSTVANGTTTPVITLNVPDASAANRGVVTTGTQTFAGAKTLTGALIGTSATFSGNGAFNTTLPVSGYALDVRSATNKRFGIVNSNSLSGSSALFYTDANAFAHGYIDASVLYLNTQSTGGVTIGGALSGTSATFSSSVKVNGTPIASSGILSVVTSTSTLGATTDLGLLITNDGTNGKMSQIGFGYSESRCGAVIGGIITNGGGSTSSDLFFATRSTTVGTDAPTERMRITSGGEVLVGTTTTDVNTVGIQLRPTGLGIFVRSGASCLQLNRTTSDGIIASFRTSDVERGSISIAGTVTSYNTSSDYRLKEDFKEIKGLEKVNAIKVYDFKWKSQDSRMDGVLAHELAEVLPYAVYGEKDEVDEDGNDKMQGVDYSKLVPIMIAAIQELKAEIDLLKGEPIIPTDNNLE